MVKFDFLSKMINVQKQSLVRMLFICGLVWFMPLLLWVVILKLQIHKCFNLQYVY